MDRRPIVKPTVPLFGTPQKTPGKPAALPAPEPEPAARPKPPGVKAKRYNLTVRLSPDERESLASIGREVGKPDPLTLAESVRWLIRQWRKP